MSDKLQFVARSRAAKASTLLSAWRWWLAPAVLALVFILIFADPFIGDWDALEYTLSSIRGYPSSMALGRSLFIFFNHELYVIAHAVFHLQPQHAYLLFKYAVVTQGVLTVIACWILTRDISDSKYAATIAALLLTFSPAFVLYSGQVMTDVPALLLTTLALIVHLRGLQQERVWLVIVGASLLGAGVNLRETVAFYGPWLLFAPFVCGWRLNRRGILIVVLSGLAFAICAGSGFGYWFLSDPSYRAAWYGWRESMRVESALHPPAIRNVWPWLLFFLATSPLVLLTLPLAFVWEWRRRKLSPMLLLAAVGLFANLLLLMNYSTAIGWRYLSTGLPALLPLCSSFLFHYLSRRLGTERRAFVAAAAVIAMTGFVIGVFLWPLRSATMEIRAAAKEYDKELMKIPRDAVMISGAQTVAVIYWRGIGAGEWDVIGPGAGWPKGRLEATVADYLKSGRRVFLDADPRWWQPCGWHVAEVEEMTRLEPRFHFRKVSPTIYEILPTSDPLPSDHPRLESLLPENRPQDVRRCLTAG
jgi:hypothetical protein